VPAPRKKGRADQHAWTKMKARFAPVKRARVAKQISPAGYWAEKAAAFFFPFCLASSVAGGQREVFEDYAQGLGGLRNAVSRGRDGERDARARPLSGISRRFPERAQQSDALPFTHSPQRAAHGEAARSRVGRNGNGMTASRPRRRWRWFGASRICGATFSAKENFPPHRRERKGK